MSLKKWRRDHGNGACEDGTKETDGVERGRRA